MNKRKNVLFVFYKKQKKQKNIFGVKRKIGKIKKKCVLSGIKGVEKNVMLKMIKKRVFFMKNVCLNKGGSR